MSSYPRSHSLLPHFSFLIPDTTYYQYSNLWFAIHIPPLECTPHESCHRYLLNKWTFVRHSSEINKKNKILSLLWFTFCEDIIHNTRKKDPEGNTRLKRFLYLRFPELLLCTMKTDKETPPEPPPPPQHLTEEKFSIYIEHTLRMAVLCFA